MSDHTPSRPERTWFDSPHASLCALGSYLRQISFFAPLEQHVHLRQKTVTYTPIQKLEMIFVALLAGAKAITHTGTTLRVDPALQRAFGLPGCADQSVLAETLNAATDKDVANLRTAIEAIFQRHSQTCRHDFAQDLLVLDIDLSPLPTSRKAEGSERCYMGRCRSRTGRKLVRVRAGPYQETVWEAIRRGRTLEGLELVKEAVTEAARVLGLAGDDAAACTKRARTEIRLDSSWGSTAAINWLLEQGYQVTTKFKSSGRVKKLVRPITAWQATASPGREVAAVPFPVPLAKPTAQYAVRTPSTEKPDGYQYAVLVTSRVELPLLAAVDRYDGRAAMEADLKSDKHGLGLGVLRKRKLAAQQMLGLLGQLAHNVLIWARGWLADGAPRLATFGIVRLVREVWAVPGRIKLVGDQVQRVRLCALHPRAPDVCRGLRCLIPPSQTYVALA
jgi:hypothetical protein